jgi:hypothetical protein
LEGKTFLICVGAMKCATSWIYHYLAQLPGVVVSPLKEVHFFDARYSYHALSDMEAMALRRLAHHIAQEGDPIHNLKRRPAYQASVDRVQMIYDDNAYFGHFARLCWPDTTTICDITPAYSTIGPDGFRHMREFCAVQDMAVRIVFVMRDPVDRLWSQLRHITHANPEVNLTERWAEALQAPRVMARADYRHTIQDIDAAFPAADVLYLFYEDLFDEAALRRLCAAADAPFMPGDPDTVYHQTELRLDLPDEARIAFRAALAQQYDFCRERFGDLVPCAWML